MDGIWAIVILGSSGCALIGFLAYLVFMAWVVRRTNDTKGLRDVAVAANAFPLGRWLRPNIYPRPHKEPLEPDVLQLGNVQKVIATSLQLEKLTSVEEPVEVDEPAEEDIIDPLCCTGPLILPTVHLIKFIWLLDFAALGTIASCAP